jgi:hypothetical protein
MGAYQAMTVVSADARAVFDFARNPENFSKFIPHVSRADIGALDAVHIYGECPDGPFSGVGTIRIDEDLMRMHWDSQAHVKYRGWLAVLDYDDGAHVTINLDFEPGPDNASNERFRRLLRDHSGAMQEALEDALAAIKAECEGTPRVEVKRAGVELL